MYEGWGKTKGQPAVKEVFVSVVGKPFAVFEASAGLIGDFDSTIARGVVVCYGSLTHYADLIQRYAEITTADGPDLLPLAKPDLQKAIRVSAEQAVQLAQVTCKNLSQIAGVEYSKLLVAGDKLASGNA